MKTLASLTAAMVLLAFIGTASAQVSAEACLDVKAEIQAYAYMHALTKKKAAKLLFDQYDVNANKAWLACYEDQEIVLW